MENKENSKLIINKKWLIVAIIAIVVCIVCVCIIFAIENSGGGKVCTDGKGCQLGFINLFRKLL